MRSWTHAVLLLAVIGASAAQFRSSFPGGRKASEDFDCPEDFGYYPHPVDCSKYYVCVFGGALEEVCTNGLVYSDDLLTCDWPRNVESCAGGVDVPRSSSTGAATAAASSAAPSRARQPSSRGRQTAPTTSRRPVPVRNNLDDQHSSDRDLAEQARLLGGIESQPSRDINVRFEGDTNKIVARRQQRLFSPDSSSGRGRFQQSLQDNSELRAKATAAPPIRISTLSSFSFGDTGTRFPEREPPRPSSTFAPPPAPSAPSTFVSSNRFPSSPSPSPFPPSSLTVQTVSTGRPPVPAPTPASPDVQTYTEPAYVAYVNDTIYDVYYIYDDEEVLYEDEVPDSPSRQPAPPTTTEATPARTEFPQRTTLSPPRDWNPTRPTVSSVSGFGSEARPGSRGRGRGGSSRTTSPPLRTSTTTRQPSRFSFSATDSFRQPPTTDLSSTRGSTAGSTFSAPSRGSTFQSTFGQTSTRASAPASDGFGSTRTSSENSFGSTRTSSGSTRTSSESSFGSTRTSTLGSTRTSTLGSTRGSTRGSTLGSTRGSTLGSTRGSLVEAPKTPSRGSVRGSKTSSSSSRRRRPTNGLRSIDSGSSSRRQPNGVTFPKRPKNSGKSKSKSSKVVNIWEHPPRRPDPVYATPIPDDPAERCDARCKLPDCNCGGTATPGGLETASVPQLVLLTFDDSVNDLNKGLYKDMFENNRVNPNGCPISATFYVSHEWTDYQQVQNLYADGHEIASHSISHSFGEQFSTSKWEREIAGQREILAAYGGVRMEDIRGMRAPFLSIGGNRMFKMLYNNNFTYDSSMPVYENNPPSWPYTLDYKIHHDCMIPPCPSHSFPGVWEVPMVMWQDLNGGRCSMVDACSPPKSAEDVYKMLIKNFERHYSSNRAVFPLYFHAAWFTTEHHKEGFMAFLDTISSMDDVWLVTNWQAIQWMRDPQPLSTVNSFQPFGCDYPERPARCTKARKCNLWHKSGVRYMNTCQPCPEKYPWTGKTGVSRP
ncbi:mucin-5AC-like isoform X5 [Amphibalanus amphitrite]|uniref:mucin-5AC-like isoform X5 n=1 Tax=Amphibalanus amphitrite TaxID=1232801 RepID=UPI001C9231AE|nr:mucin-5AC-like isoform X5 [Amphibalanus amphitrite]XP_043214424.1 mucin-5AC-like isoform X5 [Amphibalanus amphitrite]